MADTNRSNSTSDAAQPPGGGRQDHETMREAAMHPVSGPASTDVLAASGGLNVPGGEAHPELAPPAPSASGAHAAPGGQAPHEPIPGERDATTLTHREPGALGAQFSGADIPAAGAGSMDERTAYERAREGGGDAADKPQT